MEDLNKLPTRLSTSQRLIQTHPLLPENHFRSQGPTGSIICTLVRENPGSEDPVTRKPTWGSLFFLDGFEYFLDFGAII